MDHLLNDLAQAEHDLALASFQWGSLSSTVDPVQSKAAFEQVEIYRKKCADIRAALEKRLSGYPYDVLARVQEEVKLLEGLKAEALQDEVKQNTWQERLKSLVGLKSIVGDFSGYPNLNNEGFFNDKS